MPTYTQDEVDEMMEMRDIVEADRAVASGRVVIMPPISDEQLIKLMDQIDLNQTGIQIKFNEELKRYNKFNRGVLGMSKSGGTHKEIDLKTYVKYILMDGSNEEKRGLMGCFKSRIKVTEKVVKIETRVI